MRAAFQQNVGARNDAAPAVTLPVTPALTCGAGVKRPQGRAVALKSWTPRAFADALEALTGNEAWWTPHQFTGAYREETRWQGAIALPLDLDYHDANGKHFDAPAGILARLAGAELPGTLAHATPRGYRLIALLRQPITAKTDYSRALESFAAQAREALRGLGVLADYDGLRVDAACFDFARLLFAPRATVAGVARAADVRVLRDDLVDVAELVAAPLPAEPAEPAAPPADESAKTSLPPAPLDCFPPMIGDYLCAVAENRCVDPSMPATFALGVASAAIGRTAEIELRADWRESCNLWLAHVAPPGKQKSPTLKALAAPLYSFDDQLDAEHAAALAQWENECDVAESCKRKSPERPRRKQAVVADVTIESLGDVLEVSPRVAGVYDELGALLDGMGAYKKSAGADRQNWLSLHAGARITVNRKGKDPLIVPRPCLGIIGATTPATAARVLGTMNGDGMVDRFFLTASRPVANRFKTPPVPPALREHYLRSVAALCALPSVEPRVLSLTAEAAELFGNFYDATDASGAPAHFQGVIGKLCGHVGVIARTLALWSNPQAVTVSGDVMRRAIEIGKWLTAHTAHVRSAQVLSKRAAALVAWLGKHDGRADLRDVLRAGVASVRAIEETEALAREAERAGAITFDGRTVALPEGGRNE